MELGDSSGERQRACSNVSMLQFVVLKERVGEKLERFVSDIYFCLQRVSQLVDLLMLLHYPYSQAAAHDL
jgi:hypothetical protein